MNKKLYKILQKEFFQTPEWWQQTKLSKSLEKAIENSLSNKKIKSHDIYDLVYTLTFWYKKVFGHINEKKIIRMTKSILKEVEKNE